MSQPAGAKFVRTEYLGNYRCKVFKKTSGSRTTYEWRDEYDILRQTIIVSNRPITVRSTAPKQPKDKRKSRIEPQNYVRTRGQTLFIDEFHTITAVMLGNRVYDRGTSDTAFSGFLLDSSSYYDNDGEKVYIARQFS